MVAPQEGARVGATRKGACPQSRLVGLAFRAKRCLGGGDGWAVAAWDCAQPPLRYGRHALPRGWRWGRGDVRLPLRRRCLISTCEVLPVLG